MQPSCKQCGHQFEITDDDLVFYNTVSPVFAGKKYPLPPPDHCPDCRAQRRLAWRNERVLYQRSCDSCQRNIVSSYPADAPFPVYCNTCWWNENWDPLSRGIELDLSKPFLSQWAALHARVPQLAIQNDDGVLSQNCAYCYDFQQGKDCYLVVGSWFLESTYYSTHCSHVKSLMDCYNANSGCELCYECADCQHLYHCLFLQNSDNCSDCAFGFDLKGCHDCFGCYGLRQQSFCMFNEHLDETEYRRRMAEINLGSRQTLEQLLEKYQAWIAQFPRKFANMQHCEDCAGHNLFHCRMTLGFNSFGCEFCKYIDRGDNVKHCYDVVQTGNPEWCLDCVTPDNSYQVLFSNWCWNTKFSFYSDNCHNSEHLMGCIGLKRAKYCILNKQYTQEEYERLMPKILANLEATGDWGNLFPVQLSPFAYNESAASEYYPLSKTEVESRGWRWKEALPYTTGKETTQPESLPDSIIDVPDSITTEILSCQKCRRNYKIIPQELAWYRQMQLPVPDRCADCRYVSRLARRNPHHLWTRACDKCGKEIETSYLPDRPETIYCEDCYLAFLSA